MVYSLKFLFFVMLFHNIIFYSNNLYAQLRNQWIAVDSNKYSIIYYDNSISYIDNNNIIYWARFDSLSIHERIVRLTEDGGNHWKVTYTDTSSNEEWRSIAYLTKSKIVMMGQKKEFIFKGKYQNFYKVYGLILISNDSGKTFTKIFPDSNSSLISLSMYDSLYGIAYKPTYSNYFNLDAGKKNDSILITEDGWNTWKAVPLPEKIGGYRQLICFSKNDFYLLVQDFFNYKSWIYITDDAGDNWTISSIIPNRMEKMKIINKSTLFVSGIIDSIYKTTDRGINWTKQKYIEKGNKFLGLIDFDFADENNGIAIGSSSAYDYIIYTSDGGENWYSEFTPFNLSNSAGFYRIIYPSSDVAYIFAHKYIFKRTNNMILKSPIFKNKLFLNIVPVTGNILEWEKIDGADNYELATYKKNRDSIIFKATFKYVSDTVVSDTFIKLDTLEYNMEYYFNIRAFNDSLSSEWNLSPSLLRTLKNDKAIPLPLILYPESHSDILYPTSLTIKWTSNVTVDDYDLIIYHYLNQFTSEIIANESHYKDTTYIIDNLVPYNAYYFYINSIRNDTSSESAYCYFITEPATDVFEPELINQNNIIKQIIPNPISDRCKIQFNDEPYNLTSLKLYNSMGVELANLTGSAQLINGNNELELNLSSLVSGLYFIVVQAQQNIYSKSFVVIR